MNSVTALVRVLVLTLFLTGLSACGGEDTLARLDGAWQVDAAASMKAMGETLDGDLERQMAEHMLGAIVVEIDVKNSTLNLVMGQMQDKSTFRVDSQSADTVVLKVEDGDTITFRLDGDTLSMSDSQDQDKRMVLTRKK